MKHISLLHQRVPVYLLVSLICQLDDFTAQWEINGLTRLYLPRDGFTGGGGFGGGVLFFMIKQKIIRGKMRYSNLSNNMMINEL